MIEKVLHWRVDPGQVVSNLECGCARIVLSADQGGVSVGTHMVDIEVGSEWVVGSESILRAVRSRAGEPGFLEAYGLDDDAWLHGRGPLGPWQSVEALVDPAYALTRLIVLDCADGLRDLWYGVYDVRVTVRGVRELFRARRDGVRIEATAHGKPVELLVHRSVLVCEWVQWLVEREIGRAELVSRRYARYDDELKRLLGGGA
ncbi:MAG: hypothetical protein ACLP36_01155 [Acidimicrobiales bacterium]